MTNFKIIFIHGYTLSPLSCWYPNISSMLKRVKVDFSILDLPGLESPHSEEWLKIIDEECKKTKKPIVLVGHSLGTRAILLYLEKFKQQIEHSFLIAPFSNEAENANKKGGKAYPDFFKHKINLDKIKKLSKNWTIIHSLDDSSLNYEAHGSKLSKEMGLNLLTYKNRGHFIKSEDAEVIFNILKQNLK